MQCMVFVCVIWSFDHVLAAWKASVTVYNRNPLFHAGNLTKNPISADVYHMNGFSQGYIQGGMWIWESVSMHWEV